MCKVIYIFIYFDNLVVKVVIDHFSHMLFCTILTARQKYDRFPPLVLF